MIDLPSEIQSCTCTSNHTPHESCQNDHTLLEKGQGVTLKVKGTSEEVKTIVIDDCVITDSSSRCDGLFIFKDSKNVLHSFLVELKNNPTISKPVDQLDKTRKSDKYINIIDCLSIHKRNQKFVIVAGVLNKLELEKIAKEYNIRIIDVIRKNTQPYPDLRKYI